MSGDSARYRANAVKLPRRKFLCLFATAAVLPVAGRPASAQAYPSRPGRIMVGFAAGDAFDITARLIAQWLSERLPQPLPRGKQPRPRTQLAAAPGPWGPPRR